MSLILFGGFKYTTKQVVCIYQSHRRKKKTFWQKKCAAWFYVCDEMQLVVVLLPNTPARKLRMVPLQSDECMSG